MSQVFHYVRRVEFRDTDAAGIVHFSCYFPFMEEAEHAFWRHLGLSVIQSVGDRQISWPRVSASCDYRIPSRFEDELTIEVSVAKLGSKSVQFAFRFLAEGEERASGKLTTVCCRVDLPGPPQSIELPKSIRQQLESYLCPEA